MTLTADDFIRYQRQLTLPEISPAQQAYLKDLRLLMVGAGGLGAAALPYLAGAGVGHIGIADHDTVDISNLHRQVIYKNSDAGQNKAQLAANYLVALNPALEITAITEKLNAQNAAKICAGFDIILDGSDNFETKYLLNEISVANRIPLVSASVEQFKASIGIFAGHMPGAPCYACLFPQAPEDSCNCSDAGVLGTAAGLAGLYQAHMTLCALLAIGSMDAGSILSLDFKTLRAQKLQLAADPACAVCSHRKLAAPTKTEGKTQSPAPIALVAAADLRGQDFVVVDVRNAEELEYDPIHEALHIPLGELAARTGELPRGKLLALVCAGNVRSRMGAEMLQSFGFEKVCVLDRFSFADRAA